MFEKLLFKAARSPMASLFIGFSFEYLSSFMPINPIYSDKYTIAFKHPKPFWKNHYLIVPKKRIPSFLNLNLQHHYTKNLIVALFTTIQTVSSKLNLESYTIIVNGGKYQDVPQLHFHLVDGISAFEFNSGKEIEENLDDSTATMYGHMKAYKHPYPSREFHYVIIATNQRTSAFPKLEFEQPNVCKMLLDMTFAVQKIVVINTLEKYSLILMISSNSVNENLAFHLVSGKKL